MRRSPASSAPSPASPPPGTAATRAASPASSRAPASRSTSTAAAPAPSAPVRPPPHSAACSRTTRPYPSARAPSASSAARPSAPTASSTGASAPAAQPSPSAARSSSPSSASRPAGASPISVCSAEPAAALPGTRTMALRFYNTLTRALDDFHPLAPGRVGMYACGPTVYQLPHIGNYRTFVFYDVLHRYLEWKGFQVRFVMNLTDVDDRIIERALDAGTSIDEFTAPFIRGFLEDLDTLGVRRADAYPRATG